MIGVGSDSRFGYSLEIALGVVSRQELGIWMSFMKWIRLTVHWIVSDYDLGKVSVCTPSKDCVGLHMHVVGCVCVWNFETKFF